MHGGAIQRRHLHFADVRTREPQGFVCVHEPHVSLRRFLAVDDLPLMGFERAAVLRNGTLRLLFEVPPVIEDRLQGRVELGLQRADLERQVLEGWARRRKCTSARAWTN